MFLMFERLDWQQLINSFERIARSVQATRFIFCHRSDRTAQLSSHDRRGRFTDKGTPGVILGRKAKAFRERGSMNDDR